MIDALRGEKNAAKLDEACARADWCILLMLMMLLSSSSFGGSGGGCVVFLALLTFVQVEYHKEYEAMRQSVFMCWWW